MVTDLDCAVYTIILYDCDSVMVFKLALSNNRWEGHMTGDDVNKDYETYKETFKYLYNAHFPLK